jgi:signal transduction histidine kinase/HAMP domain-containing protein
MEAGRFQKNGSDCTKGVHDMLNVHIFCATVLEKLKITRHEGRISIFEQHEKLIRHNHCMIAPSVKNRIFKPRLQTRLTATIVLLLSLVMIITTYIGVKRETHSILKQMQRDGVALAKAYGRSVETALLLQGAGMGRVTGDASRSKGIKYLSILDTRRTIIGHTDVNMIGRNQPDTLCEQALHTPITAVQEGRTPLSLVSRDSTGEPYFRIVLPLVTVDSIQGLLDLGLDMEGISEAIRRTNIQSLCIALAAIFLGALLAVFFARSIARPIRTLAENANQVASGDLSLEIDIKARGEIADMAASFKNMTVKLRDYTGNLKRINAQLEADVAIIEKLHRYNESILNSISPGVLTFNPEGTITTINDSGTAILKRPRDGLVGRTIDDAFDPNNPIRKALAAVLSTGSAYERNEIVLNNPYAREVLLSCSCAPLYDQHVKVVGHCFTFEDVTEVRNLQQRIQQAERLALMGELAVGIAHEVRNPLGAIKTCGQYLGAKLHKEDTLNKYTHLIIRESDRLDQLVSRLLNFARPGERVLQHVALNALLEDAVALAMLKGSTRNVTVERKYDPSVPLVLADPKRLSQAFLNILLNGIDAMADQAGTLTVATAFAAESRTVAIRFSDTGVGISASHLPKIFYPFYTTRQRGTGLGLAIVQQIVAEHNGTVHVESKEKKGSTFTIILPLSQENQ